MTAVLEALARAEAALAQLRALLTAAEPPPVRLLTEADLIDAAEILAVPVAKVRAVRVIESGALGGFGPDGRPTILFEPHVFSRLTSHRYDATQGGVSYPAWGEKPYPADQADRWAQLEYAAKLNRPAALQSASYGLFQIMGFNFQPCGFADVEAFFAAMHRSERDHLLAFVAFLQAHRLDEALRAGDWRAFASGYNGVANAAAYAQKLAATYAALA
jgi:hypothetical protein